MSNKPSWEAMMRFLHYDNRDLQAIDDLVWDYIRDQGSTPNEVRATVYAYCFGISHKASLQELREFLHQGESAVIEQDFRERMKLRGYSESEIAYLVKLCELHAQDGFLTFSWFLQDAFDMVRTTGYKSALKMLEQGSGLK